MHSAKKLIVFCAIYGEAEPLIAYYRLKKISERFRFQTFVNEDRTIILVLTGVGMVPAAAVVGAACTYFGVDKNTRILNLGTCGGKGKRGQAYIVNKLTNGLTGRTFYPDMLIKNSFEERQLITVARPVYEVCEENILYDMEGAAIYEAMSSFAGPDQLFFIKLVSDSGTKEPVTLKQVTGLMAEKMPEIAAFIDSLLVVDEIGPDFDQEEFQGYVDRLATDLHCSVSMAYQLKNLLYYGKLTGFDCHEFFQKYYQDGQCIIRDKNKGKDVLDELADKLI